MKRIGCFHSDVDFGVMTHLQVDALVAHDLNRGEVAVEVEAMPKVQHAVPKRRHEAQLVRLCLLLRAEVPVGSVDSVHVFENLRVARAAHFARDRRQVVQRGSRLGGGSCQGQKNG